MKLKWTLMFLMIVGLIGTTGFIVRADDKDKGKDDENEKATSLDKIPAAAKAALVKEVGDETKIDKVMQGSSKDGKIYFEAQWKDGEKKMEVQVDADGKVVTAKHEQKDEDKDKK
jgi:hypothetical protein